MRASLFRIHDVWTGESPSERELEALRQARIAEIRALLSQIAVKPREARRAGASQRPSHADAR